MTTKNDLIVARPKLVSLADVRPRPIEWLWENKFPLGAVSILAGRPGGGKSFWSLWLAGRVTRGGTWPDGTPVPQGAVLILANEDPLDCVIVPRLLAQHPRIELVGALHSVEYLDESKTVYERNLTLRDIGILGTGIDELAATTGLPVRLVVIDPIGSYLGDTKENSNVEVRNILDPLIALAKEKRVAILLVAHTGKTARDCAQHGILGSTAFSAVARAVWNLYPDKDDVRNRLVLPAKGNLWRNPTGTVFTIDESGKVVHVAEIDLDADDYERICQRAPRTDAQRKEPTKADRAADWLAEHLKDGPRYRQAAMDKGIEAGHAETTLRRAARLLNVQQYKGGRGTAWCLPGKEEDGQ